MASQRWSNRNKCRQGLRMTTAVIFACCGAAVAILQAQTFTTLATFTGPNGEHPNALVQGTDGNLYGTAQLGGANGAGVVFRLTPAGVMNTLYSFSKPSVPTSLMQAKDGNLYGTTNGDGRNGLGTIFKITTAGTYTTLYQFDQSHGADPNAALLQGSDGNFYGTAGFGGSGSCATVLYPNGCGTIFMMTPAGAVTVLYSFSGSDGAIPFSALVQTAAGSFYGTTNLGGSGPCVGFEAPNGCGTIFQLSPGGVFTSLYSFLGSSDSGTPLGLTLGPDGDLYGVTSGAGSSARNGSAFKITPSGKLTVLVDFFPSSGVLAIGPTVPLLLGSDGSFYGAYLGAVFKMTPSGTLTVLYSMAGAGVLIFGSDGNLYGAESFFGVNPSPNGIVYKLSIPPSGPTISLVANAEGEAPVIAPNTWVEIKGSNLAPSGDTRIWKSSDFVNNQLPTLLDGVSVTVNGKNAFVYYISPTQVNILTPPDALSGQVQVELTNNGAASTAFDVQTQSLAPSFFVFDGTHVAAVHLNGTYVGPTTLYPGLSFPAAPNELIMLYANGFGPTSTPIVSGALTQSGTLSPLPTVKIGGFAASVQFAGLVATGEFQFNLIVPANVPNGDQPIIATYNGSSTPAGAVITIQH
jgi:uncharacterized protein (TIGR03437 family)